MEDGTKISYKPSRFLMLYRPYIRSAIIMRSGAKIEVETRGGIAGRIRYR